MKQNRIKKLRNYGISCCVSYTFVSIILSLLNVRQHLMSGTDVHDVWLNNIQIFVVCLAIAVCMFITDCLFKIDDGEENYSLISFTLGLVDVVIPVMGLGGFVFRWFNVFSYQILYPTGILLFVYLAVFGLFCLNAKHTEKELNRKINERKERKNHDKQDN